MADVPESTANPTANPRATTAEVERRIVSVLFADLVGFTTLSERLDAEDVATVQDAYFSATRETMERYGGVVEKFIGDAAMAVFGAPRSRDDDAERAVRAGLALVGAIEQIGARLGLEPNALQLRVGVNTGEVVHAISGPDAGRVTGDTVNTAARLQTAAQPGTVLIGEVTALTVAEAIETEPMGALELKGKADTVRAWQAIGVRVHPSRDEAMGALRAPTLGREAELQALGDALGRAASGRRSLRIVIVAPPGVGKSRLLEEFAARDGVTALRARVRPQTTAPYETVAQLFADVDPAALATALDAAGVSPARAAVVLDELRRLRHPAGEVRAATGDLAAERDARFDAWSTALDALASGPTAWLIEDVHWAGPDLLAFLDRAGQAPTRHGRLVLATARPSLLERAPAWCEVEQIALGTLGEADAAALIHALVGDALPSTLVETIVRRSDGAPLFIEELVRTWVSVGTLVPDGSGWRLAVQPEAVPLPATVQAIYAAQLDDLPGDARLVARRGSVAGRRVPLGALDPLDLADRREGLDALSRRGFLAGPTTDEVTGESYAYRHALLRDAGYASLARVERARLHVAMAAWLEGVAGDRADIVSDGIADHHALALESLPSLAGPELPSRAVLAARAAEWYERAAAAALGLAAHEAATRLLERAIELTAEDAVADRARRQLRLGSILAQSANLDAAIGHLTAARDGFASLPDEAAGLAEAAYELGRGFMQQIGFTEATAVTGETLATLDACGADEPAGRARLMALHAWSISAVAAQDGLIDEVLAAEQLAASVGDPALELDVLMMTTATRGEIGEVDFAAWGEIATRALAIGRWDTAVTALRQDALWRGDENPAGALPKIAAALELAEAHGMTEQRGWCELARCETLFVIGEWTSAIEAGLRALDLAEPRAYVRLAFRTWVVLLPILAARRDPSLTDRHDRWWQEAVHHFPAKPSQYGRFLIAAIGVWRALAAGTDPPEPDAGFAEFELSPHVNPHFRAAIEDVVDAWLGHGRDDLAAAAASQQLDDDATHLMRASAALVRARVARVTGDDRASRSHALEAADLAEGIGAAWWHARALRLLDDPKADALESSLGI